MNWLSDLNHLMFCSASWAFCHWAPGMTWRVCLVGGRHVMMTRNSLRYWRSWREPARRCWTGTVRILAFVQNYVTCVIFVSFTSTTAVHRWSIMTYEIKIPPKHSCPVTPEEAEDGQVPATHQLTPLKGLLTWHSVTPFTLSKARRHKNTTKTINRRHTISCFSLTVHKRKHSAHPLSDSQTNGSFELVLLKKKKKERRKNTSNF